MPDNLVQPILIHKNGTHEETIKIGAIASLRIQCFDDEKEVINEWLSGPFTKTVRRGSLSQLNKIKEWALKNNVNIAEEKINSSIAIAFPPMTYNAIPKVISGLQVSGTELPREGSDYCSENNTNVYLDLLETLSTGKATAQAAHALWKLFLNDKINDVEKIKIDLKLTNSDDLQRLELKFPELSIRDNGLTEIKSNTLTAIAINK